MSQHSSVKRRKGFTLLELLIVIAIIGILSAIMFSMFGGASESAQAAKCMTNMRNLATAAYSAASASDGVIPAAGSYEYFDMHYVRERKGWISWLNDTRPNPYGGKNTKSHVQSSWTPYATYEQGNRSDYDKASFALTNGTIWQYVGRIAEAYVCPVHSKLCQKNGLVPAWSYVMNSYFGYDYKKGGTVGYQHRKLSSLTSLKKGIPLGADKILLFAELPFRGPDSDKSLSSSDRKALNGINQSGKLKGNSPEFDCTLQYDGNRWSSGAESIGFNHKSGNRYAAHVAYADGHVAKLVLPKDASSSTVKDLTTWLCNGDDVSFSGDTYTRVKVDQGTN